MKYNQCPVPGCSRNVLLTSPYEVCPHHTEMFEGITYYLKKARQEIEASQKKGIRSGERVTKSGIFLPPGA